MPQDPNQPQEKMCPFMSSKGKEVLCTPACKLYRNGNRQNYECTFSEIQAISWNTKGLGAQNSAPYSHANQ